MKICVTEQMSYQDVNLHQYIGENAGRGCFAKMEVMVLPYSVDFFIPFFLGISFPQSY